VLTLSTLATQALSHNPVLWRVAKSLSHTPRLSPGLLGESMSPGPKGRRKERILFYREEGEKGSRKLRDRIPI